LDSCAKIAPVSASLSRFSVYFSRIAATKNLRRRFRDLYSFIETFQRLGLLDIRKVGSKAATSRIPAY
jgi:hypothetical protein